MRKLISMLLTKSVVLFGLGMLGCGQNVTITDTLVFDVQDSRLIEAFDLAAARLEKATGLIATRDLTGTDKHLIIEMKLQDCSSGSAVACLQSHRNVNGTYINESIDVDSKVVGWVGEGGESILLHEIIHGFRFGLGAAHLKDQKNLMSTSALDNDDMLMTEDDISFACEFANCTRFQPEIGVTPRKVLSENPKLK